MSAISTDLRLPSLSDVHVLVVGDVMLDKYWQGTTDRVSPEAPVPVVNVTQEQMRPGGAANVALNIVSLGARCTLVGLVGADEAGQQLSETLTAAGVTCDFVEVEDWPTVMKLRVLAQRQQLVRADFEAPVPLVGTSERIATVQNRVERHLNNTDVLVLEDYDKGAIEEPAGFIHAARQHNVKVLVDPKMKPLSEYQGASVIKPNEKEFLHALANNVAADKGGPQVRTKGAAQQDDTEALITKHACTLVKELGLEGLVVTRGGEGMEVCSEEEVRHIPARQVEVFDVTGAGDTTAATLAICMALDWTLVDSGRVANVAASLAVAKLGTAPVSGPELRSALSEGAVDRGLLTAEQLGVAVRDAKGKGEKVVFTNGCFDILHAGHVAYLEEAAKLGDRLVVAINDDLSVQRLKGVGRPVVSVGGRSRVLAGLGCDDWVVSFSDDTPEPLLTALQPDILVKGGDYGPDGVVGAQLVRDYGGEVKVLTLVDDVSTTAIVEKIKAADAEDGE